jgi:hypothetical protein
LLPVICDLLLRRSKADLGNRSDHRSVVIELEAAR